ncbi:MAG: MBL fold metallo-hydrolase [Gammaproteobacteria bacterium]
MQIIKADDYQGWLYITKGEYIAVDPWLTEYQKFPKNGLLLNRKSEHQHFLNTHNNTQKVTHLIITAHFSDHLDPDSLSRLNKNTPIYTTQLAKKILVKLGFDNVTVVKPNCNYKLGQSNLHVMQSGKPYQSTSFAYVLENNLSTIFHEAHIFNPALSQKLKEFKLDLLILTGDLVKVFGLIKVSMHITDAMKIQKTVLAKYLAVTGNSPEKFRGLIPKFLKYQKLSEETNLILRRPWQSLNI